MRAHYCWRQVGSIARFLAAVDTASHRQFALPGAEPVYPVDRPVVLRHLHLDVRVDPDARSATGHATMLCLAVADDVDTVRFDAEALEIQGVWFEGGVVADYRYDGRHVDVTLVDALSVNDTVTIMIGFAAVEPDLGLYFVGPSDAEPDRPSQVWSQNQDDDARYWFPCMDDPAMKLITSVSATVPDDLVALSNGIPADEPTPAGEGWHTFHYRQDQPHPIYLTTLLVGPFVEHVEQTEPFDVRWYCFDGQQEAAARAFANTAAMMKFYSDYLAVAYPWPRYGQVAVSEFVFGGMENTTLTTVTDRLLPDARAALDFEPDGLVAHELAHQWFGDLVTCREWAHGWLNEGFATYFDGLWREHHRGRDELHEFMLGLFESYADEDASRYRRPLVAREFAEPIDLFDRHLYHKGAWVLHMLRHLLGETAFRRALHLYVSRFRFNQAETPDLRRAIEDATGRRLGRFFDEWVYRGGYPTLSWDATATDGALTLTIRQSGGVWRLDTELLILDGDEERRVPIRIRRAEQSVVIADVAQMPDGLVLDPDFTLLARVKPKLTTGLLTTMLTRASSPARRLDAARALSARGSAKARRALEAALESDPFYGVRRRIAVLLAGRGEGATSALIAALSTEKDPRARRGVVQALGRITGSQAARDALATVLDQGDPSWFVEASALESYGKLEAEDALARLEARLDDESFNDVIGAAAIAGLAALRSEAALDRIEPRVGTAYRTLIRTSAILALGRIARDVPDHRPRILRALEPLLTDTELRVQLSLVSALTTGRFDEAPACLDRIAARANGRVLRLAKEASLALRSGRDDKTTAQLRADLETLTSRHNALRDRLEKLEGLES